jgi:chemotaxis protein histidine kinase CheA
MTWMTLSVLLKKLSLRSCELIDDGLLILNQWFDQRSNRSLLLQLQRIAHSLKGGAKMVKLEGVADIAYELENAFEQFGQHNLIPMSMTVYWKVLFTG